MVLVAFGLVPCLFVVVFVILPPPPPPPPPPSVAAADLLYLSSYAELDTAEGYVICWYFKGGNDKHVCDVSRWVYRRFLVALPHWAAFGPDSVSTPQYLVADITAPEFYLSLSLSLCLCLSIYLSIYLSSVLSKGLRAPQEVLLAHRSIQPFRLGFPCGRAKPERRHCRGGWDDYCV